MTKSNILWLGTLGVLVGGLAIDRYATSHQLNALERKYNVMVEAAAAKAADDGNAGHEQTIFQDQGSKAGPVAPLAVAPPSSAGQPSSVAPPSNNSGDDPPSLHDQVAHIDAVFFDQRQDQSWSRTAESKLTSALLPFAVGGSRIQQLECRSTLCKVRAEHTTEAGFHAFAQHIGQPGYWHGAMVSMREPSSPSGTVANVMYFSKEGQDMPVLPE